MNVEASHPMHDAHRTSQITTPPVRAVEQAAELRLKVAAWQPTEDTVKSSQALPSNRVQHPMSQPSHSDDVDGEVQAPMPSTSPPANVTVTPQTNKWASSRQAVNVTVNASNASTSMAAKEEIHEEEQLWKKLEALMTATQDQLPVRGGPATYQEQELWEKCLAQQPASRMDDIISSEPKDALLVDDYNSEEDFLGTDDEGLV